MKFIKDMFGPKAQPIEIYNAPVVRVNTQSEFARNVNRIVNLYRSIEEGDGRQEVKDELAQRIAKCADFGHPLPTNTQEAEALQKKVIK